MDRVFFLLLLWTAVTVVAAKFDCNIEETTIQNTTDATVAVPVCVDDVPIPRVPLLSPPPPPIPSPTSPGHVCGRIFQIGFNKCGTVSLSRFFAENGVPAVHYDLGRLGRTMHKRYLQGKPLIDETIYSQFLFLSDFEYFDVATRKHFAGAQELWRELDEQYPNSLFILNVRNRRHWIQSRLNHGNPPGRYLSVHMESNNLSSAREVVQLWERQWDSHLTAVQDYFKDRPQHLLVLNITDPHAGENLAAFAQRCFARPLDPTRFGHYHHTGRKTLKDRCKNKRGTRRKRRSEVCYRADREPSVRHVPAEQMTKGHDHFDRHRVRVINRRRARRDPSKRGMKHTSRMSYGGIGPRFGRMRAAPQHSADELQAVYDGSSEGLSSIDIGYKGFKRIICGDKKGSPPYFFYNTHLRC